MRCRGSSNFIAATTAVIMSTEPIVSPEYQVLYSSLLNAFHERRGETFWTFA